jgi:hypothetical protein
MALLFYFSFICLFLFHVMIVVSQLVLFLGSSVMEILNEILGGKVHDVNTCFTLVTLHVMLTLACIKFSMVIPLENFVLIAAIWVIW